MFFFIFFNSHVSESVYAHKDSAHIPVSRMLFEIYSLFLVKDLLLFIMQTVYSLMKFYYECGQSKCDIDKGYSVLFMD